MLMARTLTAHLVSLSFRGASMTRSVVATANRPPGWMMKQILVVEDDRAARASVTRALELDGYSVTAVNDGVAALEAVAEAPADLMVVDLLMPRLDGLTLCRRLRSQGDRTPILIMTARTEVSDRVSGLDAGADDYLAKPFALDELLARVRALMRRAAYGPERELMVGDLRIDEAARRAWRGERELELTKTEFDLLQLLVRNAGIVLARSQIYEQIWGFDFGPESNSLAVYIGYLRRKLEEDGAPRLVHTVRGVGYTARAS
jgi:two-component system response regulator MprA